MRYMIGGGGWAGPSHKYYSPGEIVDDDLDTSLKGLGPPPDAVALTQETYDWMVARYPYWLVRAAVGITLVTP